MTAGEQTDDKQDRQMIELLNELRVAMPGVQILLGFLLTVPFAARFEEVTNFQRDVYFATVLLAAITTAFLIAPSAAHRIVFHQGERPWLIEHANRCLIGGLITLGLALVGAILLVTDFLFDGAVVYIVPPAVGVVILSLWFVRPLARRAGED